MKVGKMGFTQELCACILGLLIIPDNLMATVCSRQDACSCYSPSGIIDLRSVGRSDGTARFFIPSSGIVQNDDQYSAIGNHEPSYYYNPCYAFDVGAPTTTDQGCQGVAVCRYSSEEPQFVDMGRQGEAAFGYSVDKQVLYINYTTKDTTRNSCVYLHCRTGHGHSLEWDGMVGDTPTFTLQSPCACYGGCIPGPTVSPGTILCVVLICLIASYLVVGMLYRKAVHGVTGLQIIPNLTFWTSLPGLIKDGYLFFISPCWTSATEDTRYEQL